MARFAQDTRKCNVECEFYMGGSQENYKYHRPAFNSFRIGLFFIRTS